MASNKASELLYLSRVNSAPKIKAKENKKSELELVFVSLTLENFLESVDRKGSQAKLFHKVPVSKRLSEKNILYHSLSGTIYDSGQQGQDAVEDSHM